MLEETVNNARLADRSPLPLLSTKLTLPVLRPGLVPRSRLTTRLEQSLAQSLTLVVAPAGWGKSSLVGEWCKQQQGSGHAIAWVSLDTGDNDPNRFLMYLSAAFDRAHPGLGETTRSLLQSPKPPPIDDVLTLLVSEIGLLEQPMTLVLDDYHLIESPLVHNVLTFLLSHLPPTLRLIIATRVDPPLSLSRLRVRGQLMEIRANDLRFMHEEAQAFLNQAMGLNLESDAISRLEARTEGWIAGLQLAALSLQGRANPGEFLDSFTGSNRYIVDYLFDEVLSRQTESMQTFLMETAILSRFCGSLCEAVTGQAGGQALLEQLEADNLFLIPLDEERRWFRYHHLFADVLQARLTQQGKNRLPELHQRAAVWFDEQAMPEDAVHHAQAGNYLELATRLVEAYSDAIWIRGGQRTVEKWLQAFPGNWIQSHPGLAVTQASVHLYDLELSAALTVLDNCVFEPKEDDPWAQDIRGRMAAMRSGVTRIQGDLTLSLAQAREALACLAPDNSLWRGVALFYLGVLLFELGNPVEAKRPFYEAIEEGPKFNNPQAHLSATMALAQVHEAEGELGEAIRLYRSALAFAAERKYHHTGESIFLFAGLGRCHYALNDLEVTEASLWEAQERKHPAFAISCYIELVRLKQAQGDSEGVAALMPPLEAMVQKTTLPWLISGIAALQIRAQYLGKDAAAEWAKAYEARKPGEQAQRVPMYGLREAEVLAWARVRLADGANSAVRARLESVLETLTGQGLHGSALEIRVLLAVLHQQEGQMAKAVAVLKPALTLAAREGYVRVFVDAGKPLLPVLRQAAAEGIEPQTIAKLLDAFRAEGHSTEGKVSPEATSLVEPLSERELEVLRLVAIGLSNPQIAEQLFLSVGTIKRHIYNIFHKLDVGGRVEAISRARELKLL